MHCSRIIDLHVRVALQVSLVGIAVDGCVKCSDAISAVESIHWASNPEESEQRDQMP